MLEEKCPKYQEVMIGSVKNKVTTKGKKTITAKDIESKNVNKIELIDKELEKARLNKPVVIPSAIDMQKVKKVYTNTPRMEVTQPVVEKEEAPVISNFQENSQVLEPAFDFDDIDDFDDIYDDEEDYDDVPFIDGYCRGSEEEVAYAIEQCSFLYISTPGVLQWIGKKVNKDY